MMIFKASDFAGSKPNVVGVVYEMEMGMIDR